MKKIQCWFTKIKPKAKLILWRKLSHRAFQKLHHGLEAEKVFNWKTYQIPTLNQLSRHKCENQWWKPGVWRSRELIQRNPHCFQLSLLLHLQVSFSKFDPKSVLWQDYGWWKNLCSQQIAKSRKRVRAALTMSSVIMILMIILWHKNNMITLIVHDMDSMWFYDNWQMFL